MYRFFVLTLLFATCLFKVAGAQDTAHFSREEVFVQPDTMRIYGTLQIPATAFSGDAVLLIAGSGPTDRNGNGPSLRTNAYQQLADSLALHGIATLRYDKRFIGKSTGVVKEQDLRFDDNVKVAAAFFNLLQKAKGVRRVFIAGHSEGATVGMLLAQKVKGAGYISIAGPGFAADSLLRKQLASLPEGLRNTAFQSLDSLKKGHQLQQVSPALFTLFRPSIQPYLISWFQHDPQKLIAILKMPVLIVQGTTDLQVGTENSDALAGACAKCKKVVIEGMNHVLKAAPEQRAANMATYNKPELPLAPGLVAALVGFIQKK